jgi:dolichol-phosphate mannosyltransferase
VANSLQNQNYCIPEGPSEEAQRQLGKTVLSLVIPTFNERQNIGGVLRQLGEVLGRSLGNDFEIIVVDDNSPDETWKAVEEMAQIFPQVRVLRRTDERGLATAVLRGWQRAKGDILGVMDGDLQHPPETAVKMLGVMRTRPEVDLVLATRYSRPGGVSDWNLIRRFISRFAQSLALLLIPGTVARVTDPMSGYFLVRRESVAGRCFNPLGYKILLEVLARGRIRKIEEVPYVFNERAGGKSKLTLKIFAQYVRHLLRLRFTRKTDS